MVSILDYGIGNIGSLLTMCRKLGLEAVAASTPESVLEAGALVLPGVGHFDAGMRALELSGLRSHLQEAVQEKRTPILGICLGMQMLADKSEEGTEAGLGFIPGRVVKFAFPDEPQRKIPNMGWLELRNIRPCSLFPDPEEESRFYFVHSYHMLCDNLDYVVAQAYYGDWFTAAVNRNNVWGTQFHPEKSHRYGMALLKNFARLARA